MLNVLRHPSRYRWVKLEAREAGKLDDVLILRRDGVVEAVQVKFSTDALRPRDPWTWDKLLGHSEGKTSLIQDWHQSVKSLDDSYRATEPRLVSNRRAGEDIVLTASGLVDTDHTDSSVLARIRSQLGEKADDFLKRFRFDIDREDLQDLNERLLLDFLGLGLPEEKWLSLKDAIRSWIRGHGVPASGEILIDDIRSACGWRQLSQLPQNLEVPEDYTLPDSEFHDSFLDCINQGSGSIVVLTAGPGVGKSTYLSHLVEELGKREESVIRHHYSLQSGRDRWERLDSRRISESLMADIMANLRPYLGELGNQNPNPDALSNWLAQVGQRLASEGRRLTVVIDGLDHVWREKQSRDELSKLFDQLIPVPEGIVLVVGTQPVDEQQLPRSLLIEAPREDWNELPRLDRQATSDWLKHYTDLMPPTWSQETLASQRSRTASSLHERTGGHPLLNRYIVEQIAGAGERLTPYAVENIQQAASDTVEKYYRDLWVGLPRSSKDVLFLFAIADFPWPESSIYDCLQLAGYNQESSSTGLASVKHLLGSDALGWSPFHSSILLYAKEQPEFSGRENKLHQATITWLENEAPEYLRRSHLWLLQRETGDPSQLLSGTNRQWAVEAIAAGHPPTEVSIVLQEAAWEAINQADYETYVDRGIMCDALGVNAYLDDTLPWLFGAQLSLGTDEYLEPRAIARIEELDDRHVLTLARHLHDQHRREEVEACFDEVNRRIERGAGDTSTPTNATQRFEIVAELAGLLGSDHTSFAKFLENFPSEDTKALVTESWATGQRWTGDIWPAVRALGEPISYTVQRCLSRYVAMVCAREGIVLSLAHRQLLASPYEYVYQMSRGDQLGSEVPEEPLPPENTTDLDYGEYGRAVGRYVHDTFFFLAICEIQSPGFVKQWLPPAGLGDWLAKALRILGNGAIDVATDWRDSGTIPVTAAYDSTITIESASWRYGSREREADDGVRYALRSITEDLLALRGAGSGSSNLSWDETATIASHKFAGFVQILQWMADRTISIETPTVDHLCTALEDELSAVIEPFGERATTFAKLATVCARYSHIERAKEYLQLSAENLISLGYHKDVQLSMALSAIESVAEHFENRRNLWYKVAPAIGSVTEFTDGDETRYLPAQLGKLLMRFDPALGVDYIRSLMDEEGYIDVQDIMNHMVENGDLSDPVLRALVSTCIDPVSIRKLEERDGNSRPFAKEILGMEPGFSSNLAPDTNNSAAGSGYNSASNRMGPAPVDPNRHENFPPRRLGQLVSSSDLTFPSKRASELCAWLCYWAETERADEALRAVEPYFMNDDRLEISNAAVTAVRRTAGRTRSYRWLAEAQRRRGGWHYYSSREDEVRARWESVKDDFPDRWLQFLKESIRPSRRFHTYFGTTVPRIVEYLIYFDRLDDAHAMTWQLVETIEELVSGQKLPIPEWTNRVDDNP